MSHMKIV